MTEYEEKMLKLAEQQIAILERIEIFLRGNQPGNVGYVGIGHAGGPRAYPGDENGGGGGWRWPR